MKYVNFQKLKIYWTLTTPDIINFNTKFKNQMSVFKRHEHLGTLFLFSATSLMITSLCPPSFMIFGASFVQNIWLVMPLLLPNIPAACLTFLSDTWGICYFFSVFWCVLTRQEISAKMNWKQVLFLSFAAAVVLLAGKKSLHLFWNKHATCFFWCWI